MKYLLILSTLIASIFSIQGCSDKPSAKQQSPLSATDYHKIDFIKFISERKNDTVDFYEGFLLDKEFVNVFEHGEFYKNDVNEFLNAGHFTYPQIAVCICAMQNLDVTDYVKLCNIVLSL
jgi:hypothetical protein